MVTFSLKKKKKNDLHNDNMDLFAYVNANIVYLERAIRNQITSLYNDVIKQQCEQEKLVLQNTFGFGTISPCRVCI